jgi:hypothetical protein
MVAYGSSHDSRGIGRNAPRTYTQPAIVVGPIGSGRHVRAPREAYADFDAAVKALGRPAYNDGFGLIYEKELPEVQPVR